MKNRTAVLGMMACLIAALTSGCLYVFAASAAGGTYAYVKGELQETLPAPFPQTIKATDTALKELKLTLVTRNIDGILADYALRLADNQKVSIRLENFGMNATRVGIRVGMVGDRDLSARIMAAIRTGL